MKKRMVMMGVIMVIAVLAEAHEFWLQTDKFFYNKGDKLIVGFKVGENFTGEPWDLKKHRIERLELQRAGQVTDLKTSVKEGEKDNLAVTLAEEGTQMIVMQSNNAFIELEPEKFNEYLKEEEHDDAYYQREKSGTLNKPGRENYSRHAKLLVQVGAKRDDTYKKVVGLPIEIIPEKNPYSLKVGDLTKFKVLFQGKPLFGAKVMVWNRHDTMTTTQPVYTMQDGTIDARISAKGSWMVSVVKMVPSKNNQADWQSYWGSLAFGIE